MFRRIVAGIEAPYARMGSRARLAPVDDWIAGSPLVRVSFD